MHVGFLSKQYFEYWPLTTYNIRVNVLSAYITPFLNDRATITLVVRDHKINNLQPN